MIDSHIQSYLRLAAGRGRDTERIGPFLATFTHHSDNPFLNYAIPDDGAAPTSADVAALIEAYQRRARIPRLEYVARLAPAVEEALVTAGFIAEGRLPLLICRPGQERALPIPDGIELIVPAGEDELLATVAVQNEAYGEGPPDLAAAARLGAAMAAGQLAILARVAVTSEPVGAGIGTAPQQGMTEVAGIGVRESFRRRGVAGALTSRLVREAFDVGVSIAFLMAEREETARIYRRAGFTDAGEILLISRR